MRTWQLSPTGRMPDVCWHDGAWLVVWHEYTDEHSPSTLVVQRLVPGGEPAPVTQIGLERDAAGFPRIDSHNGHWWLAAKDGAGAYRCVLLRDGQLMTWSAVNSRGNDPTALGSGFWAWQDDQFRIWRRPLDGQDVRVGEGRPTGLSRILPDGTVRLVDEDRLSVPGGTRPCWSGDAVVIEHPESGVIVRRGTDEVRVWPGQVTFTPRVAANGAGAYAVVTWSGKGVRLAVVEAGDFAAPDVGVESPPGTLVRDLARFLIGSANRWPRTGTHPMHAHQHNDGSVSYVKFGTPHTWERWGHSLDWIYHIEDHSGHAGGGSESYQFSDGRWLKHDMRVGEVIDVPRNYTRFYRNGKWDAWTLFPYRMVLRGHWTYRDGHEEIEFVYDPGTDSDTYEVFRCSTLDGWMWWEWWRQKDGTRGGRSEWPTSGGVALTPTGARVPWPDSRPITVTSPPPPPLPPPPVPEPPMPEPIINDAEFTDAGGRIEEHYKIRPDRYPTLREVRTDYLSYRWMVDYYTLRRRRPHEEAIREVERRMRAAIGEIDPLPPGPEPGQGVQHPFSDGGGRQWRDKRGAFTPVVLHHGELLSIFVRDELRATEHVRDAVRRGFPVSRFWATLNVFDRDASFWKGRDVGPIHTPQYAQKSRRFADMCRQEGMSLRLSFGDLKNFGDRQETELFELWADIVAEYPEAFAMAEGLNEARDTGDPDDHNPAEIERLVNILRRRNPWLVCDLSSFTGTEDADILRAWTAAWQKHLLIHDYRQGHVSDKCRHAWNAAYELARHVRSDLVLVNHAEPAGNGPWVSVTENKHELDDPEAMHVYLATMKVGRGIPTFFCSSGVIADQPFENFAGYTTVCDVLAQIPDECSGWTLVHGGDREGSRRVFGVPRGVDPLTRADHAIDEVGKRFAAVLHSPDRESWRHCTTERSHAVDWSRDCGTWGRIVVGRIR